MTQRLSHLDRIDPIHEVTWAETAMSKWSTPSYVDERYRLEPTGRVRLSPRTVEAPLTVPDGEIYAPAAIEAISLLVQFHQLSTAQIVSFLGRPRTSVRRTLTALYSSGIILKSTPDFTTHDAENSVGDLWRINPSSTAFEDFLSSLSNLDYLLLTGGRDVRKATVGQTSPTAIRHNLALSEIMLRALEMCPSVLGVWGEPNTTAQDFYQTSEIEMRNNIADGAIVLADGSVIVVETSGKNNLDSNGSAGKRLRDKAAAWAAIAAMSEVPIKVLFVDISSSLNPSRFRFHITEGANEAGRFLIRKTDLDRAQHTLFFTTARLHWFPAERLVIPAFHELLATSVATGKTVPLAPRDLPLRTDQDAVVNTLAALHTPPWVVKKFS